MKKNKIKISETSTRVLETLRLLNAQNASIQDILQYFEKTNPKNKLFSNEVILKYINTLKVFGFKITKIKDKYTLLNSLCQINLTQEELEALCVLEKYAAIFPENKITAEALKLIHEMERRFNDSTKHYAQLIAKDTTDNLSLDFFNNTKKIKDFEKYCQDGQRIKLIYTNEENKLITLTLDPCDIRYNNNKIMLNFYNPASAEIIDVEINKIVDMRQLPTRSNNVKMPYANTFLLKGDLAKKYRLRDNEKILKIEENGDLIIVNHHEDRGFLVKRLMRYGANCEALTPKRFRDEMKNCILETLKLYSTP